MCGFVETRLRLTASLLLLLLLRTSPPTTTANHRRSSHLLYQAAATNQRRPSLASGENSHPSADSAARTITAQTYASRAASLAKQATPEGKGSIGWLSQPASCWRRRRARRWLQAALLLLRRRFFLPVFLMSSGDSETGSVGANVRPGVSSRGGVWEC